MTVSVYDTELLVLAAKWIRFLFLLLVVVLVIVLLLRLYNYMFILEEKQQITVHTDGSVT